MQTREDFSRLKVSVALENGHNFKGLGKRPDADLFATFYRK
jgi:hypothetical protein